MAGKARTQGGGRAKADTLRTQGGRMADIWRTRFGGRHKAGTWRTQGKWQASFGRTECGHMADAGRTHGGQGLEARPKRVPGGGHMADKVRRRSQSGIRADARRTHGGQALRENPNPTVNCLGIKTIHTYVYKYIDMPMCIYIYIYTQYFALFLPSIHFDFPAGQQHMFWGPTNAF